MSTESSFSKDLNEISLFSDAKWDNACKIILSYKPILARIMSECIPEYQGCDPQEIIDHYIEEGTGSLELIHGKSQENVSVKNGKVILDLVYYARLPGSEEKIGLVINIECQSEYNPGYPLLKRAGYYVSKEVVAQKGRVFEGNHYGDLVKTYSIWICLNPPKYRQNIVKKYNMTEDGDEGYQEPKENYDFITIIMINLGKESTGIARMLWVLLLEIDLDKKKQILEQEYGIKMTKEMEGDAAYMSGISTYFIDQGVKQTQGECAYRLMKAYNYTFEEAMLFFQVPEEEWEECHAIVKSLQNDKTHSMQ